MSPGIYSTVDPALLSVEGWHAAAILAGGEDACLCAHSGAWWTKLTKHRPPLIHVATSCDREPVRGVRFHRLSLRADERIRLRKMPITDLRRIPLDCAKDLPLWDLKGLLAELEHHYDIGPDQLTTRRGLTGSAKLRRAIAQHTPQLAETRSELERSFIRFLHDRGCRIPSFNHPIGLSTVDAVFEDQRLIVELDGVKGHGTERRILRDHRRDLHRRADGYHVVRYHFAQLTTDADLIEAELDRHGVPRVVRSGSRP